MVMDSVEVPLPANVVVAKLLGKEGFGGSFAESEIGAPSAPFYSHLDKFSPAIICNSSQAGSSNLGIPVSVCKSGSRCALKAEISCSPYDSLFVSSDGNVFRESSFQASEKSLLSKLHENIEKGMESKTGRAARNGGSGRKGSRSSLVEESLHLVNDTGITPLSMEKIGLNDASCAPICNEKLRINRKHGHSGKKGDKRNCKLVQTTGGDSFGWKIGSINSNLIAAQNNILGIYGLKSEPVNVSKYIADLTLTDLLYGHFEVASFSQTDGKQIDNNNVNVLQAVQNVCQLLPSRSMTSIKNVSTIESNCNVKDQISRSSVDANTVERVNFDVKLGDSMDQEKVPVEASSTIQDVCDREPSEAGLRAPVKATLRSLFPVHNLPLYQPEEFLRHLKLPSVETVDSLLSQTPIQGVAGVQCLSALHSKTQTVGSIPPFPWSLLLGGPCKINLDPGRLSGNQIANQRCWVRIDTIKSMTSYCLSESQSLNFQNDGAIGLESGQISAMPASEKKVNRCLNSPTGIALVDEGVSCHSCQLASPAVAKRDIGLAKITSLIDSGHQSDSKISEVNNYSFHCCYKKWGHGDEQCIGKASSVEANLKPEESETCMGQVASDCPAGSMDKHLQKTRKLMILNQEAANTKNDFALASSLAATAAQFRQSNGTSRSHVQHDTPVSPRLLAAAQILYGMAHCLPYQDEESQNIEKNRGKAFESWPGAPSQKAAKSQKTRHSMGKDAVLELPEQAQMKELKSKEGGVSVLQNKVPVLERRKSLSQVNDMISRPTKHLASSTDRVPAGTTTGIKDTRNVGHSPDAKGIKTVRGLLDQARENSGDVDTGLVSLAGIPLHEISLKDVPREPHAQAVISTVIPLPAQKGGMTGGLKFSRGHSPDRGNGEASVKRLKPSQSHVTWANSSHLLGSSFRIQNNAGSTYLKSRQAVSLQEGAKSKNSPKAGSRKA